ncbi:hypothetical protein HPP92_013088 [Vanilla planifolia]|uniref:Major facilitator superfamily (MFS) profile domain-containing protein n=1 Tax=Vanilla planifolia TaxID=51239 RepID=A0A835QYQ6_VANPL|nr:hypothetical protein HPP92_013088 [Vanilla planifolia]
MALLGAERRTLILVNLAGIMERADEALLPAVYNEVGAALHVTPAGLGSLTLLRSIVQSSCYPLAMYLAVRHNRTHVIAVGAFLWAAATFLVAFSSTYSEIAFSRALNGVGLAFVTPAIQSLVADSTDDANRGSAFGWLQLTSNIGSILEEAKSVIKIPSFQIIVAQGITGSFLVANSLGGLIGGKLGDFLAKRLPNSGRIILSQISSGSAIPFGALLLLGLPDDPSSALLHGIVLFAMGLSISWNAAATNNPIFAEIVPERSRTSIYALDRAFESILSSFAPPVVGLLAEHLYGYKPIPSGSTTNVSVEIDRENASSLAKALYTAIAIPMLLCCLIYSFLYCTYPRDRERARMHSLIESEMEQLELRKPDESELLHEEQLVIDMIYGEEELQDDASDRKLLLQLDESQRRQEDNSHLSAAKEVSHSCVI